MGKRALKKYLTGLEKEALETQILELYDRFSSVKTYYNFVFDPREDSLMQEAKAKVANEYFPVRRKRPRARRSVAQKYLRHFAALGVDPVLVADFMCFVLETALRYAKNRPPNPAFCKSMYRTYSQALQHVVQNGLLASFEDRIVAIYAAVRGQDWENADDFSKDLEIIGLRA